jgi:hypothetical protein
MRSVKETCCGATVFAFRRWALSTRSARRCLLCQLESHLKQQLHRDGLEIEFQKLAASRSLLSPFPTVLALAAYLRTCRSARNGTHPADPLLFELLHAGRADGTASLARDVLLLAFIPALHSTARQISLRYPLLAADDTAQHLVATFLEVLGSTELLLRGSHLPFVISRMLKRNGFDWAEREARSPTNGAADEPLPESAGTTGASRSFEQAVLLRHFLFRCQREGLLTGQDLELLLEIKLEGTAGGEPGHSTYSNALRQRIKRLLRKLRRAAQRPQVVSDERSPLL